MNQFDLPYIGNCCLIHIHLKYYNLHVVSSFQTPVTVDMLWRDEDETGTVNCGENVKVKLRGVEEADVAPGFVLCDPNNPCKTGRIFDAQVRNCSFFPLNPTFCCRHYLLLLLL